MVTMKTTYKLSSRPESETSYSTQNQTYNRSTLRLWGGRTQDHSLVVCSPYTIQWIIQDICKGTPISFPFLHPVLCSTTFSAILLNKGWRSVYEYKGHQTLAYLLHIMIASWKQCFNSCQYIDVTRWNHNRTQAIKVLTHSASWVCLYLGQHLSIIHSI